MKREFPHPNYNAYKSDNDFGIIVLTEAAMNAQVVRLNPTSSYPSVGASVTVAGYGDTTQSDFTTELPESLMKVNVNVISNVDCEDSSDGIDNYYNSITSNMLCASVNSGGKDACQVSKINRCTIVYILQYHASICVLTLCNIVHILFILPQIGRFRWTALC